MKRRPFGSAFAVGLVLSAASSAGALATVDLGLWSGLKSFGSPLTRAVFNRLDAIEQLGYQIVHGLLVDPPTTQYLKDMRQKAGELNLEGMYNSLPIVDGNARQIVGFGAPLTDGTGYAFSLFPDTGFKGAVNARLGRWAGTMTMEPAVVPELKDLKLYRSLFSGNLTTADFKYQEILGFMDGFIQSAERAARKPLLGAAEQKELKTRQTLLSGGSDLRWWSEFGGSFPAFAGFIDRFFVIESLVTPMRHPVVGDYILVDMAWKIRLATFQKDYPALHDRFLKIGRVAEISGLFKNAKGERLGKYRVRTDPRNVRLQFLVKDGRILPFDVEDQPIPGSPGLKLTDPRNEEIQWTQTIQIDASGVKIRIDNLTWDVKLSRDARTASSSLKLKRYDRLDVNGRVLGFIPLAVVNAVLPTSIDESTQNFLDALIKGFGGRGTEMEISYVNSAGAKEPASMVKISSHAVFVENKFLQFAVKLAGARFIPSDAELGEVGRIMQEWYGALRSDYAGVRKRLLN